MSSTAIIDAYDIDDRKHSLYIGSNVEHEYTFIREFIVESLKANDIDSRLLGRWNLGNMYTKLFFDILKNHSSSKSRLLLEDHNNSNVNYTLFSLYPTINYHDTTMDITEVLEIEVKQNGVLIFERMTLAELMK